MLCIEMPYFKISIISPGWFKDTLTKDRGKKKETDEQSLCC